MKFLDGQSYFLETSQVTDHPSNCSIILSFFFLFMLWQYIIIPQKHIVFLLEIAVILWCQRNAIIQNGPVLTEEQILTEIKKDVSGQIEFKVKFPNSTLNRILRYH